VPTRVRKPRDKAKVEVAVQVVERWVLARLRHRRFFSLGELNDAIRELIDELNTRVMRRIGCSRRAMFEALERTALLSLPSEPFEYAEWKRCRPGLDYHIEVHRHWYSVPYRLIRQAVEARITDRTVEIFHLGVRVAVHVRSPIPHRHTTLPDHMPSAHRRYADWTPARLRREAARIGSATTGLVELILKTKPHPEQGFRACLGILRLVRVYGTERVEAACQRGIDIGARTYGSIVSILRNNLDRAYRPQPVPDAPSVQHNNIRGGGYFH
jgi:transposase